MKTYDIEAVADPKGSAIAVAFKMDLPETLAEASTMWGEAIVLNMAQRAAVIQAQATARGLVTRKEKPLSAKDASAAMKDFKPSIGRESLSETEKVQKFLAKSGISKEELLKMLKDTK